MSDEQYIKMKINQDLPDNQEIQDTKQITKISIVIGLFGLFILLLLLGLRLFNSPIVHQDSQKIEVGSTEGPI